MVRLLTILLLASFYISVLPLTMKMYSAVPNWITAETFPIYLSIQEERGGYDDIKQLEALLLTTYKNGTFEGDTAVFDEDLTAKFTKGFDQWFGVTFLLCEAPSPAPRTRCPECGTMKLSFRGENKGKLPDRIKFACDRALGQRIVITIGQVRICGHVVLLLECAPCIDDPDPATSLAFLRLQLPRPRSACRPPRPEDPKQHTYRQIFAFLNTAHN
ncbi:unnamed protein product, partial [Mesorhabditis spiculigera]